MVSDQEIAKGVESLLRQSDPSSLTSLNSVVQQLESKLGLDLSHKAAFIRDQISLLLRSQPQQQPLQHHHQQPPSSAAQPHHHLAQPSPPQKDHFALQYHPLFQQPQQQHFPSHFALPHHQPPQLHQLPHNLSFAQPPPPQPQPSRPPPLSRPTLQPQSSAALNAAVVAPEQPKESAPVGTKRRGGAGGLNKVCGVSPELQAIVGEPALPRTEIVKKLWAYIRENNLQDPSNKRKIICDDTLRLVFETDCTDMFKMNKLLAKHISPMDPAKESGQAKRLKVDAELITENPNPGQCNVMISEALAKFLGVGRREVLQSEAEKRVWDYIKDNHLEDPLNSMVILCDSKLRELLGCESISALGICEMLKRHHLFERA